MGDGRESVIPCRNFNTPVKDLVCKELLTSTFTQASHEGYEHLASSDKKTLFTEAAASAKRNLLSVEVMHALLLLPWTGNLSEGYG